MTTKNRFTVLCFLLIPFFFLTSEPTFTKSAMAQNRTQARADAQLENALFVCLARKLNVRPSELRDPSDHTRAYDPNTGRNFAWDSKQKAWIDTKTGETICPKNPAELENALFVCLARKLNVRPSELRDPSDHTRAYDPNTGRNFAWDSKQKAWIDTKTLECICPECPPPVPAPAAGAIDRCLVGTWRSESYVGASFVRYRGGSGILLSVKADGQTTIDYSGMQPVEQIHPVTQETISKEWRSGEATGHITTNNGLVTVSSVEQSKLTGKETNQYGTKSLSASGLGTVFLGGGKAPSPYNLNYACSETALAIKQVVGSQVLRTFNFKREKKEP